MCVRCVAETEAASAVARRRGGAMAASKVYLYKDRFTGDELFSTVHPIKLVRHMSGGWLWRELCSPCA